jgi:hypothetical protein
VGRQEKVERKKKTDLRGIRNLILDASVLISKDNEEMLGKERSVMILRKPLFSSTLKMFCCFVFSR